MVYRVGDPDRIRGRDQPDIVARPSRRRGVELRQLAGQHRLDDPVHRGSTSLEASNPGAARATMTVLGLFHVVHRDRFAVRNGFAHSEPITVDHVEQAKERLIVARATHLDSLASKLVEPRVHRVVEPVLAGELARFDAYDDDLAYTRDLGLVAPTNPVRIANPIYHEVIARVLTANVEANVVADPRSFVLPDGRLDFDMLMREFAAFWREHADILTSGTVYHEVAPQLVLMGFLQRVVNGGGYVGREYGVGRGRIDLMVRWPYTAPNGRRAWQQEAIELKVWRPNEVDPLVEGLAQLDRYLDRLGLRTGVLVVFDRRPEAAPIAERTAFEQATSPTGRMLTVLRA